MKTTKTIRKISTKEFIAVIDGDIHIVGLPRLLNIEATLPQLASYFKNYYDVELDLSDLEMVNVEIKVIG